MFPVAKAKLINRIDTDRRGLELQGVRAAYRFGTLARQHAYAAQVHHVSKAVGRKVYVFPASYTSDPADRGHDQYTHRVIVLTVERYEDASRPTKAWLDERVDFVWDQLFTGLDFSTDGPLKWSGRSVLTQSAGPVDVYDPGYLVSHKVFWSEVEFEFIEIL